MAFDTYAVNQSEGKQQEIDWNALNEYVVETCNLQERETLVGVVSSIVDLGIQEQADAELKFDGDEEDEAAEIEKNPDTYFKDGVDPVSKKKVRYLCYPQKPIQSVAVSVDFPDIMLDKGQFFGNSDPRPLRLWLGGQFYVQGAGMLVARPTALKITKKSGTWSFAPNHLFHKMAVSAKLIKPEESFMPKDIDKLLGKAFQFEAQVFFKESKGKQYYTEYLKFVGALGRGQVAGDLPTTPVIVQFNQSNTEEAIKEIRNHVLNTIKRAKNYEGSVIQKQIESIRGVKTEDQGDAAEAETPVSEAPKTKVSPKPKRVPVEVADIEEDPPF